MKRSLLLLAFLFLFSFRSAEAATVFFESSVDTAPRERNFNVTVRLNTEGRNINALEGIVSFPEELVELIGVSDGDSIVNFWIERPHRIENRAEVGFAGIIPGGYSGANGTVFSLVLRPKAIGTAVFEIKQIKLLLNDGKGTEAISSVRTLSVPISDAVPGAPTEEPPIDRDPPEPFVPLIGRDPAILDGDYFLSFSTTDKASGISHYEVQESGLFGGNWYRAESPYRLRDQSLQSTISVKAVDVSGNERIAELPPTKKAPFYLSLKVWVTALLGILILALLRFIRHVRRRARVT